MLRRTVLTAALLPLASACAPSGDIGASGSQPRLARAAAKEGALVIYTNMGDTQFGPVLATFRRQNPDVKVTFLRQNSAGLHARYVAETAANQPSADLVWSSAMDLQIKLINDGYAQTYVLPQKRALPTWAVWKDQGFGVTAEPIVFAYDRRKLDPSQAPQSHAELRQFLEDGRLKGPVATFDPERSGVGFLYYAQDRLASADTLALSRAMGASGARLYESSVALLDGLKTGDATFGYNVVGSYAFEEQRTDPNLVVVFPSDYTLMMSRIAFISARARHPNAAKLFLGFLMSKEGQSLMAAANLAPVRTDLPASAHAGRAPTPSAARPIEVGPALLANLDHMRRERLLADWREALGPKRTNDYRRVRDNYVAGARP